MAASRVLIVDTPAPGLWSLAASLRAGGVDVLEVNTTDDALAAIQHGVGVLIVHESAAVDVAAVADQAHTTDLDPSFLVVVDGAGTGRLPPTLAAADIVRFPCDLKELTRRVTREVTAAVGRRHLRTLQHLAAHTKLGADALLGDSEPIARLRTVVRKLATSMGVPTLVCGERGSGRALVARVVHDTSERQDRPFIRVDCTDRASLPAELFGADAIADGVMSWADEGTVFLDHVDRLTPVLQVALLRVLEDGHFRTTSDNVERATSVRLIASTVVDLDAEVAAGRFRHDLYYRLNVVRLNLPPLRRRGRDVILLANHFAALEGLAGGQSPARLDEAADRLLLEYAWPGNVRELRHVIARAVLLSTTDVLTPGDFATIDPAARRGSGPIVLPEGGVNLNDLERQLLVEALERTGGNQTHAAALLGLHRDQIRYRMLKFGLRR